MEFVVIAYDGTDPETPVRRQQAREAHLVGVRAMKKAGRFHDGGAILDDEGNMIGSVILVEFPSRIELDEWLAADPYTTDGVWENVEVRPFRRATV